MVKVGQIGIGRWGKNLLRNYANLPDTELVLVCDLDQKNIEAAKQLYPKLKFTQKIEDVLDNPEIEAVVIATPAATHYDLGKKALKNNKHVFIEKPVVLESEDLEDLIQLSTKNKKILMEGHLLLYHGAVNAMRDAIRAGKIGEVQHVYFRRTNLGAIRFEANVLWDFGPHDISVLYYLIDEEPSMISSDEVSVYPQDTAETVFTTIKFPSNKMAHLHESWLDPYKDRKIIAVGSKGMIILDELATDGKVKFIKKYVKYDPAQQFEHNRFAYHDDGVEVIPCEEVEPLRTECLHFIEAIKNKTHVRSNGQNSLRVLKTLLAAQYSMEHAGAPVDFNLVKEKQK